MKKNYNVIIKNLRVQLLILALLFLSFGTVRAQLSGTVSIGSGGTYASWSSFATDLTSKGVNGALTVNVLSDLTSSSIVYLKTTTTSSTNTISIKGNKKKLSSSNNDAAIILDGIDYVTIDELIIEKTTSSTDAKGIQFMNGADYNKVINCTISLAQLTYSTTSTISGGAYVVFSNSATAMSSTSSTYAGTNNTVENCTMTTRSGSAGPTAAIWVNGSSSLYTSTATNNTFKGNTIKNFYYYGIYTNYCNGEQIIKNDISRGDATSGNSYSTLYVIYNSYSRGTANSLNIKENKIHDLPFPGASSATNTIYGIYGRYNQGTSTYYTTISDNELYDVIGNNLYPGYNYYCGYTLVDNNNVTDWHSNASYYGWYNIYGSGKTVIKNNNTLSCESKNTTYGILAAYGSAEIEMTHNTFKYNEFGQSTSTSYTLPGVAFCYVFQPNRNLMHRVSYNEIDSNKVGAYYSIGVFTYYANVETSNNKITYNKTERSSGTAVGYWYSMWNYYCYDVRVNNNLIANNLGYYGQFGMYMYSFNSGNYKAEIRDNTIQMDATNAGYYYNYNYGLYAYMYYHNDIRVTGNSIDYRNGYYTYPVYTYNINANNYKEWEYNNYYVSGFSGQYWYNRLGGGNSFSSWLSTDFGKFETDLKPEYVDASKEDYRINVFELQNKVPLYNSNLSASPTKNTVDHLDKARNQNRHDHGAFENFMNITGTKSDATINAIVCSGHEFAGDITIKNNFADTIYGFNVTMMSDRGAKVTQKVTDRILAGNSLKVNFDEKLILNEPGITNVMIFVDAADDDLSDDTIYFKTEV